MPNLNVSFQGQTLVKAGAYYADDVSAVQGGVPPSTPPLIFLGYGYGVKPQTATQFSSPQTLLTALRGGPCSGFVQFLTSPSSQLNGAQLITYINVGEATQSTYTASSATTGVITFTSANYGLPSNQLQVSIQTGTLTGKNVTLYDSYAQLSSPTGTNLGSPFQVAYTGTATGVVYNVITSGGSAITFQALSPNAGESVSISLLPANYATIEGVVEFLNGTGYYAAQVVTNGGLPSSNLDAASGIGLSSGVSQYKYVTATLGDIVYWVNQYASNFATAAIVSGITSATGLAPTNIPYTLFTGATSTPPTINDYASGFNVALTTSGWAVFADSNASGVIALGTQHASTASNTQNGKWRRFFTGSNIGDTVTNTASLAQIQNSISTTYVYPGIWRTAPLTGVNTLYSGLYAAAAAAGMATGNPPGTPLTNKAVQGNGVEVALTNSQIDQLQQAGVMVLQISQTTNAPYFVNDFTTWQNDNNPENVFNQQVACRYALAYAMVNGLQPYVGSIASTTTEVTILNAAVSVLNSMIYSTANANGVLNSWQANSLQLTYNGAQQLASVTVNVVLIGQNRFIEIFVPVSPLNIVVTSTSTGQSAGTPV